MRPTTLLFLVDEAEKNVRRNGLMSLAALTTVTLAMAVLGGAVFGLYRLHQFVAAQSSEFEIAAFLHTETSREDALAVADKVRALPGVSHVGLVTREAAFAAMMEDDRKLGRNVLQGLEGENPLPDRLDIRLVDPRRTREFAAILGDSARFPEIDAVRDERQTLDRLLAASRLVRNVGAAIALLLFASTAFVIQNTIRLTVYARRREIRTMQLVGATPGFVKLPFVLEAVFYGLLGSAIASGLVLFVVSQLSAYMGRFESPLAQAVPPAPSGRMVALVLCVLGALLGWLGGLVSVRRFLKRV